jgi:xylulokinase
MLVPYWNGVMNPYWDDHATGIVIGLHGAHGPEHFYRAILEGIALEQRLHSERVEAATARIERFVAVGGGARSRLWCQILADVLARPIHLALTREASALGAAIVASVGAHVHTDFTSAVSAMTGTREVFSKSGDSAHYAELYERVYAPLYPNLRAELGALAELRARAAVP